MWSVKNGIVDGKVIYRSGSHGIRLTWDNNDDPEINNNIVSNNIIYGANAAGSSNDRYGIALYSSSSAAYARNNTIVNNQIIGGSVEAAININASSAYDTLVMGNQLNDLGYEDSGTNTVMVNNVD